MTITTFFIFLGFLAISSMCSLFLDFRMIRRIQAFEKDLAMFRTAIAHLLTTDTENSSNQTKNSTKTTQDRLSNALSKIQKATELVAKLKNITDQQLDLFEITQSPSASASHSRHQNSVIREIRELEHEKRKVMQAILNLGINPEIIVIDESGSQQKLKLSEALKLISTNLDQKQPTETDSKSSNSVDNVINLFNRGKDDDDPEDNTTLH